MANKEAFLPFDGSVFERVSATESNREVVATARRILVREAQMLARPEATDERPPSLEDGSRARARASRQPIPDPNTLSRINQLIRSYYAS